MSINRLIRCIFGGGEEEKARPGNPPQPGTEPTSPTDEENSSSDPATPPPGAAAPGKNPTEEGKERWDSGQRCFVVKTERVLGPELLQTVTINLPEGEIRIVGTNEVLQPRLTIEERIFAGSEVKARNFYQSNGGVEVTTGPGSLVVEGKSQPTVVVGRSGRVQKVQIGEVSGGVVIVGSNVQGNVVNRGSGGVFIGGQRVGPSQGAPRRETQVVLQIPITENANKLKEPKPKYNLEVGSGKITVEKVRGEYTISAGAGNVEIKGCDVADSSIKTEAGNIMVTEATFNATTLETGSGDITVTGTTLNSSRIETGAGGITVTGTFTGVNIIETQAGDIRVRFAPGQGAIEVQTSELGNTIKRTQLFFRGVQNPNGEALLSLTTQAGNITVN